MKLRNPVLLMFLGMTAGGSTSSVSFGQNLSPPIDFENAMVLPKGRGNPRFKWLFTNQTGIFGATGEFKTFGSKLSRNITWDQLVNARSGIEKDLLKANIQRVQDEFGNSIGPAAVAGDVAIGINAKLPIFALGVTDRFTIAAVVPVYSVDVRVATGVGLTPAGEQFLQRIHRASPPSAANARQALNNGLANKLSKYGYEPLTSENYTAMGDIRLVAKYQLHHGEKTVLALKPTVAVPTGQQQNPDKVLNVPVGDGQWDIGLTASFDYNPWSFLKANLYTGYNWQLSDRMERRIPLGPGETVSPDKELLFRDLGDQIITGTSLQFSFLDFGLFFGAGYQFQYQMQTTFEGNNYSRARYDVLEGEWPAQLLHTATLQGGLSTIGWFKQKKFFYPMELSITYTQPLAGFNAVYSPFVIAEVVGFF